MNTEEKILYNTNYKDWVVEEGKRIEAHINYVNNFMSNIINIVIGTIKTAKGKQILLATTDIPNNKMKYVISDIIYCDKFTYYESIVKCFYKLNGWELPEEKIYKKCKDLKPGEYFKFVEDDDAYVKKFIALDDNDFIFRVFYNFTTAIKVIPDIENKTVEILNIQNDK